MRHGSHRWSYHRQTVESDGSLGLRIHALAGVATGLVASFMMLTGLPAAMAAEIQFRARAETTGGIVTLADVADIRGGNAETHDRLAAINLFPAPAAGQKHTAQAREIIDTLVRQGVNFAEHRVSGASRITVTRRLLQPKSSPEDQSPSAVEVEHAQAVAAAAIREYLQQTTGHPGDAPWEIKLSLTKTQVRSLKEASSLKVVGGNSPWVGRQTFGIQAAPGIVPATAPAEPRRLVIEAEVVLPPAVIVATRPLPRETLVTRGDLTLQYIKDRPAPQGSLVAVEQAIGKETTTSIPAGRPLTERQIREPLLVRRGDAVNVFARGAGVSIRALGKARDDGSLGKLVMVELENREVLRARVSGPQEVDVYTRAASAADYERRQSARATSPNFSESNPKSEIRNPKQVRNSKFQ